MLKPSINYFSKFRKNAPIFFPNPTWKKFRKSSIDIDNFLKNEQIIENFDLDMHHTLYWTLSRSTMQSVRIFENELYKYKTFCAKIEQLQILPLPTPQAMDKIA